MKPRLTILVFAALCAGVVIPGPSAHAQPPYFGGYCWPYGTAYTGSSWDESIPYYALFPPVYYQGIVSRPYGYSPFAWVGGTPAADSPGGSDRSVAAPVVVINQYVGRNASTQVAASPGAPAPLLVKNPYVKSKP
jgi:hypothetical protein